MLAPTAPRHHAPPVEAPDPGGSRRRAAPRRGGPLLPRGRGPPPPPLRPPRGRLRGRSVPQASLPSSPRCRAFLITYRPRVSIRVAGGGSARAAARDRAGQRARSMAWPALAPPGRLVLIRGHT